MGLMEDVKAFIAQKKAEADEKAQSWFDEALRVLAEVSGAEAAPVAFPDDSQYQYSWNPSGPPACFRFYALFVVDDFCLLKVFGEDEPSVTLVWLHHESASADEGAGAKGYDIPQSCEIGKLSELTKEQLFMALSQRSIEKYKHDMDATVTSFLTPPW